MKVADLKKELEQRNIPVTKSMKKADLLVLLMSAIESECGHELDLSSANDSQGSIDDESQDVSMDASVDPPEQPDGAQQVDSEANIPAAEAMEDDSILDPVPEESAKEDEKADDALLEEHVDDASKPEENVTEGSDTQAASEPEKQEEEVMKQEPDVKEECVNSVDEEKPSEVEENANATEEKVDEEVGDAVQTVDEQPVKQEKAADPSQGSEEAAAPGDQVPADTKAESSSNSAGHSQSRKRRHDDRGSRHHRMDTPPPEEEPEEEFDDSLVVLDTYQADLNFKVSKDRTGGHPFTMEGFAYLWAGARATYGVSKGKICFECKVTEEDAVKHLPTDEPHPRVVRVGWSTEVTGLQLGEEALSFGYGGTGKFSVDRKFTDYGESFREGDVIGCFIDFSDEGSMSLSYSKNGKYLGVACTEKLESELNMFPHVLCKNSSVELNFGQKEEQFMEFPDEVKDFVFIAKLPLEERVRTTKGPSSRSECEVLMMCGLPGSGKTHFCKQMLEDHPEKRYNILGTNSIMEKMRVMGVSRKQNYANRWELLIHNSTQCLNRLLQLASRKRRNFIIDQTNVYASAQRRKMRPFAGFQRKAIVIVPSEEEFKTRFDKRTAEEGEELPEMAMLEMKANFNIPEKGNLFDDVVYPELDKEEAKKIIDKYHEEGGKHAPPPEKRSRGSHDQRNRNRGGSGWRNQQQQRFRSPPHRFGGPPGSWGKFGGRGPMGYPRGPSHGPPMHGRGGGYGGRQSGHGRMRDFSRGDRRDQNRSGGHGPNRDKGRQDQNHNKGGYGGYNRQSSGASKNQGKWGNQPSSSPHSAQSYSYGNHQGQGYNASNNNMSGYPSMGYNFAHGVGNNNQMQQGYQQSGYNTPDYSQQWMQYYQQQAQNQQYQNYYANYQQYYNQGYPQQPK